MSSSSSSIGNNGYDMYTPCAACKIRARCVEPRLFNTNRKRKQEHFLCCHCSRELQEGEDATTQTVVENCVHRARRHLVFE